MVLCFVNLVFAGAGNIVPLGGGSSGGSGGGGSITYGQTSSVTQGRLVRLAENLITRVDRTQYTLFSQGIEVLRWSEGDAVPLIPAGQYRITGQKIDDDRQMTCFDGYLDFTAIEGGTLDLQVPLRIAQNLPAPFKVNGSSLPRSLDRNQTWFGATIINEDGSSSWGSASLNQSTGDMMIDIWLDPNQTPKSLVIRNGDQIFTSNLSLDVISAMGGATISVNFDPIFKANSGGINSFYAHRFWIFDGFEDTIDQPGERTFYKVKMEAGITYKIFTAPPSTNTPQIGDTVVEVWPGNYTGVITNNGAGLLGSNDDSGEAAYSRLFFTPPTTGEYLVAVRGFSQEIMGGYYVQITNANTMVATGTITRCTESSCAIIPNGNANLQISWSISDPNQGTGYFYGSGDGVIKVAVANVGSVSQIKDASAYQYSERSVGPVGINGIVLIHNTQNGHYGALKIRNIYDDDPSQAPFGYLDATLYDQTNLTGDFSQ